MQVRENEKSQKSSRILAKQGEKLALKIAKELENINAKFISSAINPNIEMKTKDRENWQKSFESLLQDRSFLFSIFPKDMLMVDREKVLGTAFEIATRAISPPNGAGIELMIHMDVDFTIEEKSIVARRAKECEKHNRRLFVLPRSVAEKLGEIRDGINSDVLNFSIVTKLSMLHHWTSHEKAGRFDDAANVIITDVSSLAEKMPNLQEVVLRGCQSAAYVHDVKTTIKLPISIYTFPNTLDDIKISKNAIVLEQIELKNKKGELKTRIKYYDLKSKKMILKEIHLTKIINKKLNLEQETALAQLVAQGELPALILPLYSQAYSQNNNSDNNNEPAILSLLTAVSMFSKDKNLSNSTIEVAKFWEGSLAGKVKSELERIGKREVSVKGYVKLYHGNEVGPLTVEGHTDNVPKAVVVRNKP